MVKVELDFVVQGFSQIPLDDVAPPDTIQLFPPGKHTIRALRDGKPAEMTVIVTSGTADAIRRDFLAMQAKAASGTGPKPFLDFNHENREASAWVEDVTWAGEDPKTGGVRAKIAWTEPGAKAIVGKAFRQFSPKFRVSRAGGEIVGTYPNMGGLVNEPAFRDIEALFAKEAHTTKPNMNTLLQALVTAGLISAVHTDETLAVTDFTTRFNEVKAKLARIPELEANLAKATADVSAKDAALVEAKAACEKFATANAETVVAKAIADGILAPKDDAAKARWTGLIKADPANAQLLETFNVTAKQADVTKKVIGGQADNKGESKDFLVLAQKHIDAGKSPGEAYTITAMEHPEAYATYDQAQRDAE